MKLKQYQGRTVIFVIGIIGFSLLGANPFLSVFLTVATMIVSSIVQFVWKDFNRVWHLYDPDQEQGEIESS